MTDNIRKTLIFMKEKFESVEFFRKNTYRYEHSLRVGRIGEIIAKAEGFDVEALTIACLLHDIGFVNCISEEDYNQHGRLSEEIARDFLSTLDYSEDMKDAMCYGIRIHADDSDKGNREPTPFERSVAAADDIERFDAFRLYENLRYNKIEEKKPNEIIVFGEEKLKRLHELLEYKMGTATGDEMWKDVIQYQIEYFHRLVNLMKMGNEMEVLL